MPPRSCGLLLAGGSQPQALPLALVPSGWKQHRRHAAQAPARRGYGCGLKKVTGACSAKRLLHCRSSSVASMVGGGLQDRK